MKKKKRKIIASGIGNDIQSISIESRFRQFDIISHFFFFVLLSIFYLQSSVSHFNEIKWHERMAFDATTAAANNERDNNNVVATPLRTKKCCRKWQIRFFFSFFGFHRNRIEIRILSNWFRSEVWMESIFCSDFLSAWQFVSIGLVRKEKKIKWNMIWHIQSSETHFSETKSVFAIFYHIFFFIRTGEQCRKICLP